MQSTSLQASDPLQHSISPQISVGEKSGSQTKFSDKPKVTRMEMVKSRLTTGF